MASTTIQTEPSDSLGARVYSSIQRLGCRQLADVECESDGFTVVLRGKVSSFYLKQTSQTIAAKVAGVYHVVNEIEVNGAD